MSYYATLPPRPTVLYSAATPPRYSVEHAAAWYVMEPARAVIFIIAPARYFFVV
jgi:hypothetical protein